MGGLRGFDPVTAAADRREVEVVGSFRYDDLGLTLVLLDTIKQQAIEMREADPYAVGFRRPAA